MRSLRWAALALLVAASLLSAQSAPAGAAVERHGDTLHVKIPIPRDTLTVTVRDTVTVTDTLVRVDTVRVEVPAPPPVVTPPPDSTPPPPVVDTTPPSEPLLPLRSLTVSPETPLRLGVGTSQSVTLWGSTSLPTGGARALTSEELARFTLEWRTESDAPQPVATVSGSATTGNRWASVRAERPGVARVRVCAIIPEAPVVCSGARTVIVTGQEPPPLPPVDTIIPPPVVDPPVVADPPAVVEPPVVVDPARPVEPEPTYTPTPAIPRPHVPFPASTVTLPQELVNIDWPALSGRVLATATATELRAALDTARAGDVVELAPGATYVGSFPIPDRQDGDSTWVVVRTAGFGVAIGTRATLPDTVAMARIESPGRNQSALYTVGAAQGWRFVGVNVGQAPGSTVGSLVAINGHEARTPAEQPRRIILDRVVVRSQPDLDVRRCVLLNGAHLAVVDSWLDECHANGADAQAILSWSGGPYLILNTYLAGSGENVMFGGADSRAPEFLPRDITARGNWFHTPPTWRRDYLPHPTGVAKDSIGWLKKNLFELKVGVRVLLEGNVFEGSWGDGQTGNALVMKSTNQGGRAPWSETRDVSVIDNVVRDADRGINLAGAPESAPAVAASRFYIAGNLVESRITPLMLSGVRGVTLQGNTFTGSQHMLVFASGGNDSLTVVGNLWPEGTSYSVHSSNGMGTLGLERNAPGYVWTGNVARTGERNSATPAGTLILRADAVVPAGVGALVDAARALLARVVGATAAP